ncbi:MAG: hypothetical protein JW849_04720 [Phycisphaerae bacterium]|nr:hypothetical protein [Phycisphaerae bacterium]
MRIRIWKKYCKQHPWQRRVIIVILVVIVGSLIGRLTYPAYLWYQRRQADLRLIEQLGSADPRQREIAVQKAILLGQKREELIGRLLDALDTPDEGRFRSLYFVLQRLGRIDAPGFDPQWLDRYRLLEFRATFAPGEAEAADSSRQDVPPTAQMRRRMTIQALLSERNNQYIRKTLFAAAGDSFAVVREAAAPLAARLGEDGVLADLLDDRDVEVSAVAALDAGLAGRGALKKRIRRKFESRRDLPGPFQPAEIDRTASQAHALAMLDPRGSGELLCRAAASENQPEVRDRLLPTLAVLNNESARQAVRDMLHIRRWNHQPVDGVMLVVAGRLGLPAAPAVALETLRNAVEQKQPLTVSQALGAIEVLSASEYPCRAEAYELCRTLWRPDQPALLTRAATLLGTQAALEGQLPGAPSRAKCIGTLREAAQYSLAVEDKPITTPLSSAAAAVALWRLTPADREFAAPDDGALDRESIRKIVESKTSLFYVREATAVADPAAGDYVAWHVGRSPLPEAAAVGLTFLLGSDERHPEYSPDVRACGAMILALAAKTDPQRRAAVEQISRRLEREEYPTSGSFQCALLTAGQAGQLANVRLLLEMEDFPAARALIALLTAGDKTALDWLLWNANWNLPVPLEDVPPLLIDQAVGDVLRAVAPTLPTLTPAADEATRLWEARVLRETYGIHRAGLHVGLR